MRAVPTSALILSLAIVGSAGAASKHKKDESPPTAKPDATLVSPDTTPPPPVLATVSNRTVDAAPIGTTGTQAAPAVAPPPPAAPAGPPLAPVVARAVQCLRTEAPRAAKLESSVKLAADLLLQNLCAIEVERASAYAHNTDALARFTPQSERASAGLQGARVDTETGEIVNPPAGEVAGLLGAADVSPPAQMRRFAAELVIEAKTPAPAAKPADPHRGSH